MIINGNSDKVITSEGGKLVFAGEDIIFDTEGTGKFEIAAPITWQKPSGSAMTCPSLVFSRGRRTGNVTLSGQDDVAEYGSLYAYCYNGAQRTLFLGGSGDRTFNGPIGGYFHLEKQGTGTLTLKGQNDRRGGGFYVNEGKVIIAHNNAPNPIVQTNGICEFAEGVVFVGGTTTVTSNGLLRGLGTTGGVSLQPGARIAPGTDSQIGTLTFGTHSTLPSNMQLYTRLGLNTNDMLKITGNLTLPATGEPMTVSVSDVSGGTESVKDKSYIVGFWTGNNPSTTPVWTVTTTTPSALDVSEATVTVTGGSTRRIILSGLKPAKRGTLIKVQ